MTFKRIVIIRIILIIMCVIWMGYIFMMSAETAKESTNRSDKVIDKYLEITDPDYSSLSDDDKNIIIKNKQSNVRSLAHGAVYVVLGALATGVFLTYKANYIKCIIMSTSLCIIYAVSDEIHQIFVPGRTAQLIDLVMDTAGSLLGIFIVIFSFILFTKITHKKIKI